MRQWHWDGPAGGGHRLIQQIKPVYLTCLFSLVSSRHVRRQLPPPPSLLVEACHITAAYIAINAHLAT